MLSTDTPPPTHTHTHTRTRGPCVVQEFEFVVTRQEDQACYDLTVGQRIYVQVGPAL